MAKVKMTAQERLTLDAIRQATDAARYYTFGTTRNTGGAHRRMLVRMAEKGWITFAPYYITEAGRDALAGNEA